MNPASNPLLALSDHLAELAGAGANRAVAVHGRGGAGCSGLLWQEGLVVTALPALERVEEIGLVLPHGRPAAARLAGRDALAGIALLRAETGPATPPPHDANMPAPGSLVLALGQGSEGLLASHGIIASKAGRLDLRLPAEAEGGPVFGADGRLLGMVLRDSEGLPRLVPAQAIAGLATALRERGGSGRGYLGLAMQSVSGGVMVLGVDPGSPGAQAGLILGDLLQTADGVSLHGIHDLLTRLAPERVGQALELGLQRAGQPMRITVTIGERPGLAG